MNEKGAGVNGKGAGVNTNRKIPSRTGELDAYMVLIVFSSCP